MRERTEHRGRRTQRSAQIEFQSGSAVTTINFPSRPPTVNSSDWFREDTRQRAVLRGFSATTPTQLKKKTCKLIFIYSQFLLARGQQIHLNSPSVHVTVYTLDLRSATCSDTEDQTEKAALNSPLSKKQEMCSFLQVLSTALCSSNSATPHVSFFSRKISTNTKP